MLFNQRLKTFNMGKKARTVVLGERGKEPIYVVPRPKPILEFHSWVLMHKLRQGFIAALAVGLGAIAALLGWQFIVGLAVLAFFIGFITGGDVESGPP